MTLDPEKPGPETCAHFALMVAQSGAMERYWRLAVETSQYQKRLNAVGILKYTMWIGVSEAARFTRYLIPRIPPEHHDHALFLRWDAWGQEYEEIYEASPKWRLKGMISEVSETVSCRSWPKRWERDIWEWALSPKEGAECLFYKYRQRLDGQFRDQLEALVIECDGFLYNCEESQHVVFAPSEALPAIWQHQDHLAAIDRARPFGFFDDYSRPDPQRYARQPTDAEERLMAARRRKRTSLRPFEQLRRFFSRKR